MTKLYIGNLPYSTDDGELYEFVVQAAPSARDAKVIMDREKGTSKGFGFVAIDDEDAEKAIETLNGQKIGSRIIRVSKAIPREDESERRGGSRHGTAVRR